MGKISNILEGLETQKLASVEVPPVAPVAIATEQCVVEDTPPFIFSNVERVPANWEIRPEGDKIRAVNNITNAVFIGELSRFNRALAGQGE